MTPAEESPAARRAAALDERLPVAAPPTGGVTAGLSRIAHHSALNAVTQAVLLATGFVFVPLMLRAFGLELFGVLTVTWMVLGQLGWLHLGLGQALTKFVSRELATGKGATAARLAWSALVAQVGLGLVVAVLGWAFTPALVHLFRVSPANAGLVAFTLRVFAITLPLDMALSSLNGVLQAGQRFVALNALRALGAAWTYVFYALGIWRHGDLQLVVIGLAAYKALNVGVAFVLAARVLPELRTAGALRTSIAEHGARLVQLLRFGGWVSVGLAIAPLLVYFDRWTISALMGAAALPFYTTGFNLLARLSFIPTSITATLFPAFSVLEADRRWPTIGDYYARAHRYLVLLLAPILFGLFAWAHEILRLWLGAAIAAQAVVPFRILTVGFSIALLAPVSSTLLQGGGRPDLCAKIYLALAPVNALVVWALIARFGLVGAALSFTLRAFIETGLLWVAVHRSFPVSMGRVFRRGLYPGAVLTAVLFAVAYALRGSQVRRPADVALTLLVLGLYALVAVFFVLDRGERSFVRTLARGLGGTASARVPEPG